MYDLVDYDNIFCELLSHDKWSLYSALWEAIIYMDIFNQLLTCNLYKLFLILLYKNL